MPTLRLPTVSRPARRAGALCALLAALALAGQASAAKPAALDPLDRGWLATATGIADSMLAESERLATSGGSLVGAKALLGAGSSLFDTAVAYGIFSTCSTRLKESGSPGKALRPLETALRQACVPLARSSDLFLKAVRDRQAALLVRAERDATTGLRQIGAARQKLAAYAKAHP